METSSKEKLNKQAITLSAFKVCHDLEYDDCSILHRFFKRATGEIIGLPQKLARRK